MTTNSKTVDHNLAINNLLELLAIEGVSLQEGKIAEYCKQKLFMFGCKIPWTISDNHSSIKSSELPVDNLVLELPGTKEGPRMLFVAHLDTVPLCRGAKPKVRGKRIIPTTNTGLGADNRTGVACIISTLEAIYRNKLPHPPLSILLTVGEEIGLMGARKITPEALGYPRMGFNFDSGDPSRLIIGGAGADRWDVRIQGICSHAGVHPEDGVSALLIASKAIAEIADQGYIGKIDTKEIEGTANIGFIRGGEAVNQVMDSLTLKGECRSFKSNSIDEITQKYRLTFETWAQKIRNSKGNSGTIQFQVRRDYEPFCLPKHSPVVRKSQKIANGLGLSPTLGCVHGGLDANPLNQKGIPTITLGAGQHNAHTREEYVDIEEYITGCHFALKLATSYEG